MCCRRELCDEWGCPYLHWVHNNCGDRPAQGAFWANLACPHPAATSPTSFLPTDSDRLATSEKNCPLKQRNYSVFFCWSALSEHICTLDSQSLNVMFCFIHIIVSKITLQAAKLLKCTQVVQRVQSPFLKKEIKQKFLYGLAETYHSDMMHTAPAWNSLPEASSVRYRSHWSPTKPWDFAFR